MAIRPTLHALLHAVHCIHWRLMVSVERHGKSIRLRCTIETILPV